MNEKDINLNLALLRENNLNDFWCYEGSLTTSPYTEGIIWTIFIESEL
jgi:carbonic anhydrase